MLVRPSGLGLVTRVAVGLLLVACTGPGVRHDPQAVRSVRMQGVPVAAGLTSPAGSPLGGGFTVPVGAILLGRVVPRPLFAPRDHGTGWWAVMALTGKQPDVIDVYREQMIHQGLGVSTSCIPSEPPSCELTGTTVDGDRYATAEFNRRPALGPGRPAVSSVVVTDQEHLLIPMTTLGSVPVRSAPGTIPPAAPLPPLAELPQIGEDLMPAEAVQGRRLRTILEPNTTAVGPVALQSNGAQIAVVAVTGDVAAVIEAYLDRFSSGSGLGRETAITMPTRREGDTVVREVSLGEPDFWTLDLVVVDPDRGPAIMFVTRESG